MRELAECPIEPNPIITAMQLAVDLPLVSSVPLGYGHNFATDSYIDAWFEVTEPVDWSDFDINRLKAHLAKKHQELDRK